VIFRDEKYRWTKDREWRKFLELPSRTGQPFELALSGYGPDDREALERHGWRVRDALGFTTGIDEYRDYLAGSRGEITVAKDQNIRLCTGWFSNRSVTYLAAGRPVVTQDTGFGCTLPTGEVLFPVLTLDEAVAAIEEISCDQDRLRRAATAIAREHFDAGRVLRALLDDVGVSVGVSRPRGTPGKTMAEPIDVDDDW
jgi:hypothetical protein